VLRFHLDENVHPAIAQGLRHRGIDVTATNDVGLVSASDEHQLAFATGQGRVLFTHDSDFLVLHSAGTHHRGIAYSAPGRRSIGDLLRSLILMAEVLGPDEMVDHIEYV
jgi:hypothetical protein